MAAQGEYRRLEDFEEDSPPGEEELLVHVTEGLQGSGGKTLPGGPGGWGGWCCPGGAGGHSGAVWGSWPPPWGVGWGARPGVGGQPALVCPAVCGVGAPGSPRPSGRSWGGSAGARQGCPVAGGGPATALAQPPLFFSPHQTPGTTSRTWIISSPRYPCRAPAWLLPSPARGGGGGGGAPGAEGERGGSGTTGARSLTPPNIYHFHQKNGFACMMLSDLFELV